jgi:hypothetical protein
MKRLFERGWFKWLAFPAVVLLLAVVVGLVLTWYAVRWPGVTKRNEATAELDATDPLWRTTALTEARNAALPPPDQNAAVQAVRAKAQVAKSFMEWTKLDQWRSELKPGHLPHPEDVRPARKVLADSRTAIEAARKIRHLPSGGIPLTFKEPDLIGTLLTDTQNMREVASILDLDALIRAYDRKGDEAFDSAHAVLAVGRGLGDEPTLISQLVRMAIVSISARGAERILGMAEVSEAKLAELQAAFLTEAKEPRMKYGLRGERAMFHRMMENIDSGAMSLSQLEGGRINPAVEQISKAPVRATIPEQQATMLRMMNRMIAATDMPYGPERDAEMTASEVEIKTLPRYRNIFVALMLPAMSKVAEADTRIVAHMHCAAVALACERYRLKHKAYPTALADLPKDILAVIPVDPYTGRPLHYKKTADGAVVYSTGTDRKDNGGDDLDSAARKGDFGFRLFAPEHRRKPPLPKEKRDGMEMFFDPGGLPREEGVMIEPNHPVGEPPLRSSAPPISPRK